VAIASVRRACIDIGSNTTRLLVAECGQGQITEVYQERAFTYLAWSGLPDGAIEPAKLDEVARVVAGQLDKARDLGCAEVRAVGTAAIRRAPNGQVLTAAVRDACGLEVEILTAEEEARLAFVGAASAIGPVPHGPLGVVDVGGGSSELVVGEAPDRVAWSASFPLGSGDLARSHLRSDPPTADEVAAARSEVDDTLRDIEVPHPEEAAAVGGSAASLSRLAGRILDAGAFAAALAELIAAPRKDVARRFGLEVERVRLLPAGLLILQAASERFGTPLVVAGGGLREGVLLEAAGG
jgi:exopolyphosphatase / guanosine-5'-triphosphate,3'-diphosphate pyrophosphatase